MKYDYDLLVIGSGSAGFSAANAAKGTGRKIGIVEEGRLGGECPNWACVPTKVLLKSAKVLRESRGAGDYGVHMTGAPTLKFDEVMKRRSKIVSSLGGKRIETIAKKLGFDVLRGRATFIDAHTVQIDEKTVTSSKFVIATGSTTYVPPIPGLDKVQWLGFKEALTLSEAPESMIILGGGPVGCEIATFYASVGTKVTLVQSSEHLLNREEPEISEVVEGEMVKAGVEIHVGAEVVSVDGIEDGIGVSVNTGKGIDRMKADKLVLATGKRANTGGLGCKAAGVKLDARGNIVTSSELKTGAKNIWAAGDVDGGMRFTHTAHYEGSIAGRNAFSKDPMRIDERVVPRVTFVDPEVASVGETEAEVREKHKKVLVGRFQVAGLGRAYIEGHSTGLMKIVADPKTRKVLGGHMVGERAGEVIHQVAFSMYMKATIDDLAGMIHAYPTYSEAVVGAASMAEVE